jgi:hypothetical protein
MQQHGSLLQTKFMAYEYSLHISSFNKILIITRLILMSCYSKCHVTSNKAKSNLECAEVKFQRRGGGGFEGVTSERRPVEAERTSVNKFLPPQATRGI